MRNCVRSFLRVKVSSVKLAVSSRFFVQSSNTAISCVMHDLVPRKPCCRGEKVNRPEISHNALFKLLEDWSNICHVLSCGRYTSCSDFWKTFCSGVTSWSSCSFSTLGWWPSDPGNLVGLSICNVLVLSSVISPESNLRCVLLILNLGILVISSFVNALKRNCSGYQIYLHLRLCHQVLQINLFLLLFFTDLVKWPTQCM